MGDAFEVEAGSTEPPAEEAGEEEEGEEEPSLHTAASTGC